MLRQLGNYLRRLRDKKSIDVSALAQRGELFFSRQAFWLATSILLGYDVLGYSVVANAGLGPIIGFRLFGPDGSAIEDFALVDSGADHSAFPLWMMETFGISKTDCHEHKFPAAGCEGTSWSWQDADGEHLRARVRGRELPLRAVFTDTPIALLGRNDFLRRFKVKLNQRAQAFAIKPYYERPRRLRR